MSILRSTLRGCAVAGVLALAGCSGSASVGGGVPSVDRAEVEEQAKTELAKTVGREPEEVSCPGDLPGRVAETMRCTLTDSGTSLGVTVTVTRVDGADVKFDVEVDQSAPT